MKVSGASDAIPSVLLAPRGNWLLEKPAGSSMDSFAQQLLAIIEQSLERAGFEPNQFQLAVREVGRQKSAGQAALRQLLVTYTAPRSAEAPGPAVSKAAASVEGPPGSDLTVEQLYDLQASAHAYWERQPPEVRRLRSIDSLQERTALAMELAQRGHLIDAPIMLWDWDPLKTMMLRGQVGYTWVPSALQQLDTALPGAFVPGMRPYDPNNPPPGSILVDTSFAVRRVNVPGDS